MKKTAYILLAALGLSACNYLEIEPVGKVIPHKTSEFRALLTEGYFKFPYSDAKSYTGLLSDEVGKYYENGIWEASTARALAYNYTWDYTSNMKELPYQQYYRGIFLANAVIGDVMNAESDSQDSREQLLGEAYALRAYAHFDLVNLYGPPYNAATAATDRGVPIANYIDIEQKYRPSSVEAVYKQIIDDLEKAIGLMSVEKVADAKLNYRFTRDAAQAFSARVSLYMGAWQQAYATAKLLLPKYELVDFNGLTDKTKLPWTGTSPEAILALERPFSGASRDLVGSSILSDKVLGMIDQANDLRMKYIKMLNAYDADLNPVPLGYGVDRGGNDRASIRIAEMYLIAAEAGAHLPAELSNAREFLLDLQAMRFKTDAMAAQRTKIEAMNAEQLLAEIADERAREFLLEGHRWMDLRRTTRPQIVKKHLGSEYTLRAGDSRYTLPYPQSAINNNPDLNQ